MKIIEINQDNFNDIIKNNDVVILEFYATWCNQCKALDHIINNLKNDYQDIIIGKINIDKEINITKMFKITNVPSLIKIINQKYDSSINGLKDEKDIELFIGTRRKNE